jgi:hypothetical protein
VCPRRVDDVRMSYLRSQFESITTHADDVGARTTLAFTLAIGQHFMAATHGGHAREDAIANAFALLVRA